MGKKYQISNYLVIYLDILGQSQKIKGLKRIPANKVEDEIASRVLHDTADKVIRLRKSFDDIFSNMKKSTGILDGLSPDKRKQAESLKKHIFKRRGIADSYIITIPLYDKEWGLKRVFINIWAALGATCGTIIIMLADGSFMRGGIVKGWGTILPIDNNDEVYGLAVSQAVEYEEKIAQYPRIIIGKELWEDLCQIEKETQDEFIKKYVIDSKKFICKDNDGSYILDYLGEGTHSIETTVLPTMVKIAYENVIQEYKKLVDEMNYEQAGRHYLLRQYIESRLFLWNIEKSE